MSIVVKVSGIPVGDAVTALRGAYEQEVRDGKLTAPLDRTTAMRLYADATKQVKGWPPLDDVLKAMGFAALKPEEA